MKEGLTALHVLAVAAVFTVLFSLAPTYLKYMGHNRAIRRTMVGAAAVQVILLVLLVPQFAATGAAVAYTISMCGMYLVFTRMAHRELVMLKSGGNP